MVGQSKHIRDDFDLLNRMIKDMREAPLFYRPTNYWQNYELRTIKYLKDNGLKNFRSYGTDTLSTFSAGTSRSMPLDQRYKNLIDFKGIRKSSIRATIFKFYGKAFDRLGKKFDIINLTKYFDNERNNLATFKDFKSWQYRYAKTMETVSGLNVLDSIEDSSIGNPYDLFQINGKRYTKTFLRYFEQMVYVNNRINLRNGNSVMEIGTGYGGNAEVYAKSFPHITYFNFDIPLQLYVSQQYLSTVFPGKVYTYENFLANEKVTLGKYQIFLLPTWALESISGINFELFINSASFQEMEPDIVKNYYELIKDKVNHAYLFQLRYGTYKKTSEHPGGCVEPLKADDFPSIFKDFKILSKDDFYMVENPYVHLILKRI